MNDHPAFPAKPPTSPSAADRTDTLAEVLRRTPARILVGRSGPGYLTRTQLELRQDHAAAVDAVHTDLVVERDLGIVFVNQWGLFEARTYARCKSEYLLRPDFGRRLDEASRGLVSQRCSAGADLQIVIGDGLSAAAVIAQVPKLLPLLANQAKGKGWSVGPCFFVRHCRVGVLNDIGELLSPTVAVLLIGERPGLATAESLSAYLAYEPRSFHTDAQRNVISNIHGRGVSIENAAQRILALAEKMRKLRTSGVAVKEDLPDGGNSLGNPSIA